jgi:uncharacterized protein YkwD
MRKILLSLVVILAIAVVPAVGQAATKKASRAVSGEQQVLLLLNEIRQQHGLSDFTANTQLRNAARFHSVDMLQNSYFDHDSRAEAWDVRVGRYIKAPLIGEDLAWGTGSYGTPEGIVSQWMHSPVHRAVILTAGLHRIGIGLATGTFEGSAGAVMATADFAA